MNARKILASAAIAGGLAAGALGVSTGVASADVGHGGPVPASWATDHGGWGGGGHGGGHGGPGWGPPPPPPPYYGGGGWNGGGYGGGPIPGGWNGGWEPNGGICLGPFCI
jgi:hypothetical protein